jgi:hypothetical protein
MFSGVITTTASLESTVSSHGTSPRHLKGSFSSGLLSYSSVATSSWDDLPILFATRLLEEMNRWTMKKRRDRDKGDIPTVTWHNAVVRLAYYHVFAKAACVVRL